MRKKCNCGYGQKGVRIGYRGCPVHDSKIRFMPVIPDLKELIEKGLLRIFLKKKPRRK